MAGAGTIAGVEGFRRFRRLPPGGRAEIRGGAEADRSRTRVGRAPSWGEVLSASVAVGAASGVLEMAVLLTQVRALRVVTWSTLMVSHHAAWMVPATGAAIVVAMAMLLIGPMLVLSARRVRERPEAADEPGPAWAWAGMVLGTLLLLGPLLAIRGFHPIAPLALAVGIGFRIRRGIVRPTVGWRRGIHRAAAIGVVVLALLVVVQLPARALLPATVPPPGSHYRRPNLLWIVLDTLRADRMGVYGYPRPTTPRIDAWARSGLTFEMARSTTSWTLPSHISMFTGLLPSEHGACIDETYDKPAPTIAEHLRANGYRTSGIVANVRMCNAAYGVGRGFGHYEDYPWRDEVSLKAALSNSTLGALLMEGLRRLHLPAPEVYPFEYRQPASEIAARGRRWLDSYRASSLHAPFFLFLNFMDVHGPYLPTPEMQGRFWKGPPPTKSQASPADGWRAMVARDASDPEQRPARQLELEAVSHRLGDLYDECLAGLDADLGRFLDGLRDAGMLAKTWVIITADHGDHFGEHDQFGHGSSLYNELTHVPLIVIPPVGDGSPGWDPYPHLRGRRIGVPVSLRDLPATMAEVLHLDASSPFPGRSLARHWQTEHPEAPDPVLSELDEPRLKGDDFRTGDVHRMESIIDEGHNLISYVRRPTELFDLFADPKQQRNLAERPEQAPRRGRLEHRLDDLHHRGAVPMRPER